MAINKVIYDTSGEAIVDENGYVTVYGIDGASNRVNKVQYGQTVLLDVTDTTAEASDVAMGETFYTKDGVKRTGTKSDASAVNINPSTASVTNDVLTIIGGGTASLQSKTVTPTTSSQSVTADNGYDGLDTVTVNAIPSQYIVPSGSQMITSNGTVDVTSLASVTVDVQSESATVGTATATPSSNSTTISFSVQGEPKMFAIQINKNASYISGSSSRYITSVISDGSTVYTTCIYKSSSNAREYNYSTSSFNYSNGTLTITSAGSSTVGYFMSGTSYRLIYVY